MPVYRVRCELPTTLFGTVLVTAADEDEARDMVVYQLVPDEIKWIDQGNEKVEVAMIEEVEP